MRLGGVIEHAPAGTNKIVVLRQPIGVSLLITPSNFPAAMATRTMGPALAAGCSVILEPAAETPLTARAILAEAGVPDGVVNIVPSTRTNALSPALLDQPLVRKVSFSGSTEVGRVLLEHAAHTVVSAAMELGGNAPFVVLPDADLDVAPKRIVGQGRGHAPDRPRGRPCRGIDNDLSIALPQAARGKRGTVHPHPRSRQPGVHTGPARRDRLTGFSTGPAPRCSSALSRPFGGSTGVARGQLDVIAEACGLGADLQTAAPVASADNRHPRLRAYDAGTSGPATRRRTPAACAMAASSIFRAWTSSSRPLLTASSRTPQPATASAASSLARA